MPARQKSALQKRISGTEQPCRPRHETPAVSELVKFVPDPPDWVSNNAVALEVWTRLAPLLVADGLAVKDIDTLANLCVVQAQIIRHARGEDVSAVGCMNQFCRLGAALGLAPGWRARVAVGGKKEPDNPFEAFKAPVN